MHLNGRIYRGGQTNEVNIYRLVTHRTIDHLIQIRQQKKQCLLKKLITEDEVSPHERLQDERALLLNSDLEENFLRHD